MKFDKQIAEHAQRTRAALAMGGEKKLAERRSEGILNARERIAALVEPGSFLETGLFATSVREEVRSRSPADGKITGYGKIGGRDVGIVSNDFTVMGASSSTVNTAKVGRVKRVASTRGMPMVFLGESTGARMPDVMGAANIGAGDRPTQYRRMRETPWVSAVLGHCYGSSSWYAALADFVVMRKGAITAVSSTKLTSMAISEAVDPEALGGWKLHTEVTGMVDLAVDTDQEALAAVARFLSYLPSHCNEPPPVAAVPPGSGENAHRILEILPESRTQVYDVRKILALIYDLDSVFELKPRFGKSIVTAFARLNGRSVGIVASNPMAKGGAIDPESCEKVVSFLVLCDSFNIPLVFMVDQPGFLIGVEGERKGAIGRVMNWMNALSLVTVPKISVVMRKSYGQAVLNMGGGGNADEVVCWFSAEINFMDPRSAVPIVHGVTQADDPERHAELLAEMTKGTTAYDAAAANAAHAVIDPTETRAYLTRLLEIHEMRMSGGVGEHLMRTWPTSY
ncbi:MULTISPECIES: acyl-CoA carboxylase subunit beta [unclassified Variovorax]|uniref:acyl-CoA carboxylase subunit beta n=1 Tax=unclassified Variovorax TaxID=663243 RepID=UPI001317D90D|nr:MULTISPECIES: carboxyl transferase domain-containing protein [unclassified Variovorax]VTU45542.1 Methylmalonyl-CoA carboxyltransferase 12S subunit [Variovorax sp. PBL-E5]VTU46514.1 Methylmalonyl-CoA carboxyltransferase 12S subunit [Variovorax sp. SRS16]